MGAPFRAKGKRNTLKFNPAQYPPFTSRYVVFPTSNSPLGFFVANFSHYFERYYFSILQLNLVNRQKEVKETRIFFCISVEKNVEQTNSRQWSILYTELVCKVVCFDIQYASIRFWNQYKEKIIRLAGER
jgi:hypothetical protein